MFVSHDRDFIDGVANRIIEISARRATEYSGSFAEFVISREERITQQKALAYQQAKEMTSTERFIERFSYKASKAKQVQSRIKALEKLEKIIVEKEDDQKQTLISQNHVALLELLWSSKKLAQGMKKKSF